MIYFLVTIIIVLILVETCQFVGWYLKLDWNEFKTKKEALLYLIPLYPAISYLIKKFRELK